MNRLLENWKGCLWFDKRHGDGTKRFFLVRRAHETLYSLHRQGTEGAIETAKQATSIIELILRDKYNGKRATPETSLLRLQIFRSDATDKKHSVQTRIGELNKLLGGPDTLHRATGGYQFDPEVEHEHEAALPGLAQTFGLELDPITSGPVPAGALLRFEAWAASRYDRWLDLPPIETSDFRVIRNDIKKGRGAWHGAVFGAMASGKSNVAFQIASWAKRDGRFRDILVLPLGLDFAAPNHEWLRTTAVKEFFSSIEAIPKSRRASTLIIIEDLHESRPFEPLPWTKQGKDDPRNALFGQFSILITCRQESAEILHAFRLGWKEKLELFYTSPNLTADELAVRTIGQQGRYLEQSRRLFHNSGQNLVLLSITLMFWRRSSAQRPIDMLLAHEAVIHEVERLAADLKDHGSQADHNRCLALIWCLGGLDLPVDIEILRQYFRLEVQIHGFWKTLTDRGELAADDSANLVPRRYRILRHPAWGQLVIHVLDTEYERRGGFSAIPSDLVDRFLASTVGREYRDLFTAFSGRGPKPSVCLLFSLLHAKRSSITSPLEVVIQEYNDFFQKLAHYCSGRYIFDEFIESALLMIELDRRAGVDEVSLCTRQIDLAPLARRATPTPWSAEQNYTNRVTAYHALNDALAALRKLFGDDLEGYPDQGRALYEEAYYDGWFGALEVAVTKLQKSIDIELRRGPKRRPFAEMSRIQLTKVQVDQGRFEEALETGLLALKNLESLTPDSQEESVLLSRFKGNAAHAIGESLLCMRRDTGAKQYFERTVDEFRAGKMSMDMALTNARLALARGDAKGALACAEQFRTDVISMKDAEKWEEYHRIVGDAHFLAGEEARAIDNYRRIIPSFPEFEPPILALSPEASIAQRRLNAIEKRIPASEIFKIGNL